jgi:glycosyltransferase involved in cell wall biosynthesis
VPGIRRLIFLHSSDELYGADRMLLEMVAAARDVADVQVWLPNDLYHPAAPLCAALIARNIPVRHLNLPILRRAYQNPAGLLRLMRAAATLVRNLRSARADVLYCTTSAALLAAPLGRLARIPTVLGSIQEIWSGRDRYLLGAPARACSRLLSISGAVTRSLPEALRRRTTVVPNGTPEPTAIPPVLGGTRELTFLVASRWNGWKGHRTLLAAWELAGAPGQLMILGGRPPSGEWVDVPGLVAQLSDPDSVSIIGEVSDPGPYFAAADVVVMPSDSDEPFGLIAIEAFARGRPVIASAGGGLMDIVTEGRDGWLFPPGNAQRLAEVLTALTPDAVSNAGAQARTTYDDRFTVERFAQNWRAAALPDRH